MGLVFLCSHRRRLGGSGGSPETRQKLSRPVSALNFGGQLWWGDLLGRNSVWSQTWEHPSFGRLHSLEEVPRRVFSFLECSHISLHFLWFSRFYSRIQIMSFSGWAHDACLQVSFVGGNPLGNLQRENEGSLVHTHSSKVYRIRCWSWR